MNKSRWIIYVISLLSLKFVIFYIDPLPMFFLGDSGEFIDAAVTDYMPTERSFLYGFVIKCVAVPFHSLTPLLFLQVISSALVSILLVYILLTFLSVKPSVAVLCGVLCALEPLQLLYERYVLTESLSLLIFAIYITIIFHYVRRPKISVVILFQLCGTLLIAFRLSFLPLVLINSVTLPLLAIQWRPLKDWTRQATSRSSFFAAVALHLVITVGLVLIFHAGYKQLNGHLSHRPPAYQWESGYFLLSAWAPVVMPEDFPRKELAQDVFGHLKYNLRNRQMRNDHRWSKDGLIMNLRTVFPDLIESNRIASETAKNALRRNPLGIFSLAMWNFADFWDLDLVRQYMWHERGDRSLADYAGDGRLLKWLREEFNLDGTDLPYVSTFTNRYFFRAIPWYLFLLYVPFFAFIGLLVCGRSIRKYAAVVFLSSSALLAVICFFAMFPNVRYLHPVAWLSFLTAGLLLDQALKRLRLADCPGSKEKSLRDRSR